MFIIFVLLKYCIELLKSAPIKKIKSASLLYITMVLKLNCKLNFTLNFH